MSLPKGRYPETQRVISKEEIKRLHEGLGIALPDDFDLVPEKDMVVLRAVSAGVICGMVFGVVPPEADFCRILHVFLSEEYRNPGNVSVLIRDMYCSAHNHPNVKKTVWRYETGKPGENDPYMAICKRAGITEVKDSIITHVFDMELHGMMRDDSKLGACDEAFVLSKGFGLIRCIDAKEKEKKELEKRIEKSDHEVWLLSPFDNNRDEDNSFFLTDRETGMILGWMICRRKGEKTEEIARMYVFPDGRRELTGLCLGGFVLKRLESTCDRISFRVKPGNSHMLRFLRMYFRGRIYEGAEKLITMDYPETDQSNGIFFV